MKLGSLFDGIGGALLSAEICGITPVWASEIEPFPIKVTEHHFPNVLHLGDITEINGAHIEPVDIIVGGSPCQDLSVAGKRAGLGGERSGLFMEQTRIVKEMRDATNGFFPRYMVWENVPGAFSSNRGEDFRVVLEETAKIAQGDVSIPRPDKRWAKAGSILGVGWSISWRTFDAQFWGVPQRRRRIYLVADFRGQTAPEILFEREGVSRDIAESGEKREGVAEGAERSTCFAIDHVITTGGNCTAQGPCVKEDGPMFTLKSGGAHAVCYDISHAESGGNKATVFSIGGFNSEGMKSSNPHSGVYEADTSRTIDRNGGNPACNQGGMAVVEPVCLGSASGVVSKGNGEAFLMYEKHMSLGCGGGQAGQGYPAAMVEKFARDVKSGVGEASELCLNDQGGSVMSVSYGKVGTLRAQEHGHQPIVLDKKATEGVAYSLQGNMTGRADHNGPQGSGVNEDVSFTLNTVDRHAVFCGDQHSAVSYDMTHADDVIRDMGEVTQTLQRRLGTGGNQVPITMTYSYQRSDQLKESNVSCTQSACQYKGAKDLVVDPERTIRRLIPLECERLQGFPDNWTNIEGASDTARYKALGNSFAIPNILFVISRIKGV